MHRFCSTIILAVLTASLANTSFGDDRRHDRDAYGFGKKAHIEALAADLNRQSNDICWEMHRYYQKNSNYKENYKGMYEIRQGAKRIFELAKQGYYRNPQSNDQLAADLHGLDKLFDRIDADVRRWRSDRRDSSRGQDLAAMMDECEDTLDHLMDDYGIRSKIRKEHGRYGDRSADREHGPRR